MAEALVEYTFNAIKKVVKLGGCHFPGAMDEGEGNPIGAMLEG